MFFFVFVHPLFLDISFSKSNKKKVLRHRTGVLSWAGTLFSYGLTELPDFNLNTAYIAYNVSLSNENPIGVVEKGSKKLKCPLLQALSLSFPLPFRLLETAPRPEYSYGGARSSLVSHVNPNSYLCFFTRFTIKFVFFPTRNNHKHLCSTPNKHSVLS